jgi:hypothetical protein
MSEPVYHVTHLSSLPSILTQGLNPDVVRDDAPIDHTKGDIYVSTSVKEALYWTKWNRMRSTEPSAIVEIHGLDESSLHEDRHHRDHVKLIKDRVLPHRLVCRSADSLQTST